MLSTDSLIDVEYSLTQSASQAQNTNALLVLTPNTIIDTVSRLRGYQSDTAVENDFGENSPEAQAARVFYAQKPQPSGLFYIGRWVQIASSGQLIGATLSPAQQLMANFNPLNDAGFSVTIDGAAVEHIGGINLTNAGNLNAVAAAITNALGGAMVVVWNADYQRFEASSGSAGANSSISFLSAPSQGVEDLSGLLGLSNTSAGAYQAPGLAAETAAAAAALFDSRFGGKWYALVMPTATSVDHLAVASLIEATSRKHFYGATTADAGCLVATSTVDLASILSQAGLQKTALQYSSTSEYAIISALARILTVDYTGSNTTITLMWQDEPLVVAEQLNDDQLAALKAKNCNVFAEFDNGVSILLYGTTVSTNVYIDVVLLADVFAIALKTALFNRLYTAGTKVPQTDPGMHLLVTDCENVGLAFVANGGLAPGIWQSSGFGALSTGNFMEKGFYVYAPPLASQSQANRAARMAGPIQIAGKLAGAIHTGYVGVTLNP